FASMIPELSEQFAAHGGSIILECEPRLAPLFARSFPHVHVHPSNIKTEGGNIVAHYDWLHDAGGADRTVEMGSLPKFLRRSLDRFPKNHAYLVPSSEWGGWTHWMGEQGSGPYIGLCWRSGLSGGARNLQYSPLEAWGAFLRDVPGNFVSLQY